MPKPAKDKYGKQLVTTGTEAPYYTTAADRAKKLLDEPESTAAVDIAISDVDAAIAGTDAFGSIGGAKKRGGSKTLAQLKSIGTKIAAQPVEVVSAIDTGVAAILGNLGSIIGVGGVMTVLNHPTLIGNVAQIAANVADKATNATITATWVGWGTAVSQMISALGTVAGTVAGQTAQGPVVPVAITAAIMQYRAKQPGGAGDIVSQIKQDAKDVAAAVKGQGEKFKEAYAKEAKQAAIARLKEIAAGIERPTGPGASATTAAVKQGAPAVGSEGVKPGFVSSPPSEAVQRMAADLKDPSKESAVRARAAAGDPDAQAALSLMSIGKQGMDQTGISGGRRRRKARKTRRAPKRRATRRMPRFVY